MPKHGAVDRVGDRLVRTITPRADDKLYEKFIEREDGERLRTGEKLVMLCRKAWRVVRRLFPDQFPRADELIESCWIAAALLTHNRPA